jgi:hypothetical protein
LIYFRAPDRENRASFFAKIHRKSALVLASSAPHAVHLGTIWIEREAEAALDLLPLPIGSPGVEPSVHPIAIQLEFVKPVGTVRCLLNELGELRFDPGRWRSLSNPSAGRDRR